MSFPLGLVLENMVLSFHLVQRELLFLHLWYEWVFSMYTNEPVKVTQIINHVFNPPLCQLSLAPKWDVCDVIHLFCFNFVTSDPGKTLPEALDYCTVWLQTVPGEIDSKSGIPPSLVMLQIKDFLNGPGKKVIIRMHVLFFFIGVYEHIHRVC